MTTVNVKWQHKITHGNIVLQVLQYPSWKKYHGQMAKDISIMGAYFYDGSVMKLTKRNKTFSVTSVSKNLNKIFNI